MPTGAFHLRLVGKGAPQPVRLLPAGGRFHAHNSYPATRLRHISWLFFLACVVAGAALSFACFGDAGVFLVVFVSFGAVCFAAFFVVLSFGVLGGGDWFHVRGVAADSIAAGVV